MRILAFTLIRQPHPPLPPISAPPGIIAGLIINSIEAPLRRKHNYHPAVCNATLRDSYQFEVNHAQYVEDVEDEVCRAMR